jgi:ZIP family zinc transporter
MLIFSITLHNIPEGLAVGVAFGSAFYGIDGATTIGAMVLALGIGLQNFPEGSAVSLPLRREGFSRGKAFFWGQLSGFVEPIAGVLGALLVLKVRLVLPYLLAFAAGAMIYVVIEELIPESQTNKKKDLMAFASLIGFCLMMVMDIALG